jgi:rare lipoprotein A
LKRLVAACTAALLLLQACGGSPPRRVDPDSVPDAVPRAEPRATRGNPPFYEVFGERYHVLATADGYRERGIASWYGPDFHGETTSSGEPYDMYAMTAAHKTLPLPSYVRVTNLANGRSIVVRVNDRGPFKRGRIIDLSYVAATKLDMIRDGTATVEVTAVGPGSTAVVASAAPAARLYAQAGAFADERNARQLANRLESAGIGDVSVETGRSSGRDVFRVRVGPLASVAAYDALVERLLRAGFDHVMLALD